MKKNNFLIIIFLLLFINFTYAQKGVTILGSGGVLSIDKEHNFNINSSISYSFNSKYSIGVEILNSKFNTSISDVKVEYYLLYGEYSMSNIGFIKDKLYFSLLLGSGMSLQKNDFVKNEEFAMMLGTKLNYKVTKNTIIGWKSGFYLAQFDNAIVNNLFISYRF